MIERDGNIFDTEAKFLAHGVNVQGFMGAGIAKQFREYLGEDYFNFYRKECLAGVLTPGKLNSWFDYNTGVRYINLATQNVPGPDARYDWLFTAVYGLAAIVNRMVQNGSENYTIALPEIGCGIGGLEWSNVKRILVCIEEMFDYAIEFEVWHYDGGK